MDTNEITRVLRDNAFYIGVMLSLGSIVVQFTAAFVVVLLKIIEKKVL